MPIFCAINPVRMVLSPCVLYYSAAPSGLQLNLNVYAAGQVELHQRVHGLRGRINDIQHALVGADFELIAAFLVHVRAPKDGEPLDPCWQRNRAVPARGALAVFTISAWSYPEYGDRRP